MSCELCDRPIQSHEAFSQHHKGLFGRRFFHDKCGALPQMVNNPLHALHPLTRAKTLELPRNDVNCYYCEKPLQDDQDGENYLVYECRLCSLYMHSHCALIPLPAIMAATNGDAGQDYGAARFSCHQDPMILKETVDHDDDRGKRRAKCFACHSLWSGPAICCSSEDCVNFLHKSCAELPQEIRRSFHPHRAPLVLQVKPQPCDACCKKDCWLVYHCQEKGCNFAIGTECAYLEANVKWRRHDHSISLIEKSYCNFRCDYCQKSYEKGSGEVVLPAKVSRTQTFMFRCMECDLSIHFLCGPLPSTVEFEYHIHPLRLVDSVDVDDNSDEYFCDACEEERDPHFRVYYCKECKYVAHVHCLISKIMEVFRAGGQYCKDVELWALGENRWDQDHDQAEEESTSENELTTLKDITDRLTTQERKKLQLPFRVGRHWGFYPRAWFYTGSREKNSHLDRKGSIEDIDIIQKYFQIGQEDFSNFINEITHFTPEKGLELDDDKLLRQKVVNVQGYKVPRMFKPILKTLLKKYRDFHGLTRLSPAMKSVTSTLLCVIIDRMCRTNVEDMTKEDLKHWYFCLTAIGRITNFGALERDSLRASFEELARSFLGLEAIRCEEDSVRMLDQRIAELKAELRRCEELHERYRAFDKSSSTSSFMKDCLKRASESKLKAAGDVFLSKLRPKLN